MSYTFGSLKNHKKVILLSLRRRVLKREQFTMCSHSRSDKHMVNWKTFSLSDFAEVPQIEIDFEIVNMAYTVLVIVL